MTESSVILPLAGGVMIGVAALILLAFNGRVMGVSGIWSGLIRWSDGPGWRLAFVLGSITAPLGLALLGRPGDVQIETTAPMLIVAGLLVGFGSALGAGCTSGHGICGMSRFSPRSIVATLVFMAVAIVTVFLVRHVG
ncbi:MAG: YeeE/YedE family protein [Hyphomicrobiaceae bacterium]|nr:YeeE/YedE family protein [Hyphomicrobiaceae bacterium]